MIMARETFPAAFRVRPPERYRLPFPAQLVPLGGAWAPWVCFNQTLVLFRAPCELIKPKSADE